MTTKVSGEISIKQPRSMPDKGNMAKSITIDDVLSDLKRARRGVDYWVEDLGDRLADHTMVPRERERRICEATRMALAYGQFLHSLTFVVLANGCDRPELAWDEEIAGRALELFQSAEEAIKIDPERRERVLSRSEEFKNSLASWCPEIAANLTTRPEDKSPDDERSVVPGKTQK